MPSDLKQTIAVALASLAVLWIAVGSLFFHGTEAALHAAWGLVVTLLLLAFTGMAVRRSLLEHARVHALEGSEHERLRALAERGYFAQLVENSSDAIISRALDGTILSWNRAAEALFGYTADEAIGRSIEIIVPPERLAGHRVRRSGSPTARSPREVVRLAKDGRRLDVQITTAPILSPEGEPVAVSVIARDITESKRAALAMSRSEARMKEAQRLARIGNWELDIATGALAWSDEIFRLFELDAATFTPTYEAFLERVHPDERDAVDAAYKQSVSRRRPYSIDHGVVMPDGRVKHVHEECVTEYDASGAAVRSIGTVQDITERKLAEEARARLAAIVESADEAIVARTLEGTITSWNGAAERLFGYSAQEAIGQPMTIIGSAAPRRLRANTELLKRGERVPPFESVRPRKDGTLIPVLSTLSPIKNEAGAVIGAAVIIRDLREQKKAQEQLALAAAVFQHAAEGIIVTDAENRVVSVNPSFTRITGYEAHEVLGRNPRVLASGMHSPDFYASMWESLRTRGAWQGEVWDKRKSGELFCQSLSITAIDGGGQARHYCAIFIDITRRKNAELALVRLNAELEARVAERTRALEASNDRLRQANEELSAFSYSVSHDLRGPVRRIHAYSSIALDALPASGNGTRKALDRIKTNAEHMAALIEDLLRLSQVSTHELDVNRVDLTAMALDIATHLREQHPLHNVELAVEDGLHAPGDRGLLHILLENLIGNAWKFTARVSRPRVAVGRTSTPRGRAYYVRDNGAGFDMSKADKLFQPFNRLHESADYAGTGIGLSIVQRVAARRGGQVWAQAAVGEGATFYFTLGEAPEPD